MLINIESIKSFCRKIKHLIHAYPIYHVIDEIQKRETKNQKYHMLECFSNTGEHQMPAYIKLAESIEAWEILPQHEKALRRNLPPNATIRITNSIDEADQCVKKFNWIVMDAHMERFGPNKEYCEHFDILPKVFKLCMDEAILIFNVIPNCPPKWKKKYPEIFGPEHLERRNKFYKVADSQNLSYGFFEKFYKEMALHFGYHTLWLFFHQRHLLHYLVMKIRKVGS